MLETVIDKYFSFLEKDFGFFKIPEYQYVREIHTDYMKGDLIIKLIYEGSYVLEILKLRRTEKALSSGQKRTVDYDYNDFKRYSLRSLDRSKRIYNSVASDNFPEKDLWYYSKLLSGNPEILNGDMKKLSGLLQIFRKL